MKCGMLIDPTLNFMDIMHEYKCCDKMIKQKEFLFGRMGQQVTEASKKNNQNRNEEHLNL